MTPKNKTGRKQNTRQGCPGGHDSHKRRGFLKVGFLGGLGMSLPLGDFLSRKAEAAQKHYESFEGKAKSVIYIYLPGGMAHQESFDPKPFSPLEYRGPFDPIATNVPGVQFGGLMKKTAKVADRITVCRSMTHGEAAHERGRHNMMTGYRPSPALRYPSFGSVVSHELGERGALPPYICVPQTPNQDAGSGYLPNRYGPFSLGSDPARSNFKVNDLSLPKDVDHERFRRRQSMLESVNQHFEKMARSDAMDAMDAFHQQAYQMILSPASREAFNLGKEPDYIKNEYGKNSAGMRFLLARRLVESGVRFVTVTYGGWDHHSNIQNAFNKSMPPLDQAYAALITDLDRRGMLDETMVVLCSEFGRTPKINARAGRDHWPKVFSVALAGGGFKRGYVHGSSNAIAAEPEESPLSLVDYGTTIYHQLGITADKELMAPGSRPIEIIDGGKVVKDIIS